MDGFFTNLTENIKSFNNLVNKGLISECLEPFEDIRDQQYETLKEIEDKLTNLYNNSISVEEYQTETFSYMQYFLSIQKFIEDNETLSVAPERFQSRGGSTIRVKL